jgi:O-methyltransferase
VSGTEKDDQQRLDIDGLLAQIAAGAVQAEVLLRALDELVRDGKPVPLPLEAATLEHYIAADPGRIDLKRRLAVVMRQLGREPDREFLAEVRDSMLDEEYSTDFQALLDDFGKQVRCADMEPEFTASFEQVRRFTMTTIERLYALWSSIGYICEARLPGAVVECGVWRGGSMMLAALELRRRGMADRELWLYDTFVGLPKPDAGLDIDILGHRAIDGWEARTLSDGRTYWAYATEADVRANMAGTSYPEALLRFVPGLVEETIPRVAPARIALLRIDTDWYASYWHALRELYDRVVPGGVVIFDDYGHFKGARQAVDEFRAERRITAPLLRVDYSCRMMIKLSS